MWAMTKRRFPTKTPVNSPFTTNDSADLPAFLAGLRTFIDQHNTPGPATGHNPADTWLAELDAIAGPVGKPVRRMLDFIGSLHADGLFDVLLAGVGNIKSNSQNYRAGITDLSALDPHCRAVSFLQRNKGNPWFGFEVAELTATDPRPRIYDRRVRKKMVEISWNTTMIPPNIPLFLWRWFARVRNTTPALFTDMPDLAADTFDRLADRFPTALIWPDQGGLFVADNATVMIHHSSIGWTAEVMIPDASAPHDLGTDILSAIDIDPTILASVIYKALI